MKDDANINEFAEYLGIDDNFNVRCYGEAKGFGYFHSLSLNDHTFVQKRTISC